MILRELGFIGIIAVVVSAPTSMTSVQAFQVGIQPPSLSTTMMTSKINHPSSSSTLFMATWSDSKAVMDYQNFLQSGEQELSLKSDVAGVIVRPFSSTSSSSFSSYGSAPTAAAKPVANSAPPPPPTPQQQQATTTSSSSPKSYSPFGSVKTSGKAIGSYLDNLSPATVNGNNPTPVPAPAPLPQPVAAVPVPVPAPQPRPAAKPATPVTIDPNANQSELLVHALLQLGQGDDIVVTPDQDLPAEINGHAEYPIYITLPPWQLEEFLVNLPPSYMDRTDDFVFFSGGTYFGNIEDVLKNRGFCRDTMTQVLISGMHIHVTPYGLKLHDVSVKLGVAENGEDKTSGECAACGKWNGAISERFERNQIKCHVDFYREWRRRMWERTVLDAVFVLLGSVRSDPTNIRQVAQYYSDEVADLAWEMSSLLRGWKAITLMYGFEERLFGFAEFSNVCNFDERTCYDMISNDSYPYVWGNYVMNQSPLFVEYLWYAQLEKGLFQGIQLPPQTSSEETKSVMRKGILRADGVI